EPLCRNPVRKERRDWPYQACGRLHALEQQQYCEVDRHDDEQTPNEGAHDEFASVFHHRPPGSTVIVAPVPLLWRYLRDLVALYAEARHQSLLAEDEGVDVVLQRGGRGGLRLALVEHDDARTDANLETIRVDELIECLRVHEEHRVAVLLASRLQSKRRAGRLVKVSRRPILQQRTLAVLTTNPEAGFLDARKDQYCLRFCSELF